MICHLFRQCYCRKTYINPKTDELYKLGEIYKRPVYAETLRRIAENGVDEFYGGGETGKMFVEDLKKMGGIIDHQDLRDYK